MFREDKNITLAVGNVPVIEGRFQVGKIAEFQCGGVIVISDVFSVVPRVGQVVSGFSIRVSQLLGASFPRMGLANTPVRVKKLCPRMGLRDTPVWVIRGRGREGALGIGHRAGARPRVGL